MGKPHRQGIGQTSFQLPPGVSFEKQLLPYGHAYIFRHQKLGELGRLVLHARSDGQTHVTCEVVGDSDDPMTAQRAALFKPIGNDLTQRMEYTLTGKATPPGLWDEPPPRPPEPREVVKSKLIPCERCGANVALLIFAPPATDLGRFEDYARKMYPQIAWLDLPTYIIGPPQGDEPLPVRPAEVWKVWPKREPVRLLRPDEFNPIMERLAKTHCG